MIKKNLLIAGELEFPKEISVSLYDKRSENYGEIAW